MALLTDQSDPNYGNEWSIMKMDDRSWSMQDIV